jgi:hypothetical protein
VTFRFSGGDEYIVDLEQWRDRLREDVRLAATTEAGLIASIIRSQWPIRTTNLKPPRDASRMGGWARPGELRRRVQVDTISGGSDAIRLAVRSTAPHSHLLELGTVPRAYTTRRGNRHFTGSVSSRPLFIPSAILHRQAFKEQVRRILGSPEPSLGRGNPTVTGSL